MTGGLVFILHSPAAKAEADELAVALSPPLVALPMAFADERGARHVAYGAGAMCIILWDEHLVALSDVLAKCARIESTIICGMSASLPSVLAGYVRIDRRALLEATASDLRDAILSKQGQSTERTARPRRATPSLAAEGVQLRETGKHSLAMRSAWGLAATVAVASIVAPLVGSRAGASSMGPEFDPANGLNESAEMQAESGAGPSSENQSAIEPPPMAELIAYLGQTPTTVSTHSLNGAGRVETSDPVETELSEEIALSELKSELPTPVAALEEPKTAVETTDLTQKPEAPRSTSSKPS